MEYEGPAAGGGGKISMDYATVHVVQQALIARGFSVGKTGADGIFGKNTEKALLRFSNGRSGYPDDANLRALGVNVMKSDDGKVTSASFVPAAIPPAQRAPAPVGAPPPSAVPVVVQQPGFFGQIVPGVNRPLWLVLLGGVGVIAVGVGVAKMIAGSAPAGTSRAYMMGGAR
jgi:peptidoglycan hydrolase-like protein with peptidoglycan-binding domain